VTLQGTLRHLDTLQKFADDNGGTRASGSPGYTASADYVAGQLQSAGYIVTRQPFDFPFFEEIDSSFAQIAPVPTTYVDGTDYDLMEYSGAGVAQADVVPVDINLTAPRGSTSGCEATDFLSGGTSTVTGKNRAAATGHVRVRSEGRQRRGRRGRRRGRCGGVQPGQR
jgi:hypothetical protein